MNFVTMMALGFPMQTIFEILGQPYFPFFLVFCESVLVSRSREGCQVTHVPLRSGERLVGVIINVSVAFLDVADMDPFYSYGRSS
jgi:hypothetical protein